MADDALTIEAEESNGTIHVTNNIISYYQVIWEIPNFTSLLSRRIKVVVHSPEISQPGPDQIYHWQMRLDLNKGQRNKLRYLSIYVKVRETSMHQGQFMFGIVTTDLVVAEKQGPFVYTFDNEYAGTAKFLSVSTIMEHKNDWLNNNTLKLYCEFNLFFNNPERIVMFEV